jgi:hypothetical protein
MSWGSQRDQTLCRNICGYGNECNLKAVALKVSGGVSRHWRQTQPSGALSMIGLEGVSLPSNMRFPSKWDWKEIAQKGQDVSCSASTNVCC